MTNERLLASVNLKCTAKRIAMMNYLETQPQPVTAEEVARQAGGNAHVSTVYRFLGILADKGILAREVHQDGIAYWQLRRQRHGHLLTCQVCHSRVQLPECPLSAMEQRLAQETGYRITGHLLEFTGICPACAAKGKRKDEIRI